MWHEAVGGRGSCEVATCLNRFIECLPQSTKKLYFFLIHVEVKTKTKILAPCACIQSQTPVIALIALNICTLSQATAKWSVTLYILQLKTLADIKTYMLLPTTILL